MNRRAPPSFVPRSRPTAPAPRLERGFTLVETLVVLVVGTAMLAVAVIAVGRYHDGLTNQAAAQHATAIREAGEAYIADNRANLLLSAVANASIPILTSTLVDDGYLPPGFDPRNAFGQSVSIQVLQPTPGRLQALAITTGGDAIDGQNLRRIAQLVGADGGYIDVDGMSAVAQGAFGGWQQNLEPYGGSPGAGHLVTALFAANQAAGDDNGALRRSATAGRPELNRMATSVDMSGNSVTGAGTVGATSTVLPSGNSMQVGSSFYYGDGSDSAIRQTGGLSVQNMSGGAAPISQVGNVRSQGTLNADGNVIANGSLSGNTVRSNESYASGWFRSQGDGGWYSSAYGGGWHMTDPSWIRVYNGKSVYTAGTYLSSTVRATGNATSDANVSAGTNVVAIFDVGAGRNVTAGNNVTASRNVFAGIDAVAGGRVTASEYFHPLGSATCDAACPANGLIGVTATGAALSCVDGKWAGAGCAGG